MVKDWGMVIKTDCGDLLITKDTNDENQPTLVMVCRMEDIGEISNTISYISVKVRDNTYNNADEGLALAVFKMVVQDVHDINGE